MITQEQFNEMGINISDVLCGNAAVEWIEQHTTIDVTDIENIPFSAKLFIKKFVELNTMQAGVSSESIEGLSQSFDNTDKSTLIWQFAEELLQPYLKSKVRVVMAERKWL